MSNERKAGAGLAAASFYTAGQRVDIPVTRRESGFDRACDQAYALALMKFGATDNGYFNNVEASNRSTDSIIVEFVSYRHSGSMGGQQHEYIFTAWIQRDEAV